MKLYIESVFSGLSNKHGDVSEGTTLNIFFSREEGRLRASSKVIWYFFSPFHVSEGDLK